MDGENVFERFRRMLIEDDNFRARFAENPSEALRAAGIDIPRNIELPKIDKEDLDARVNRLKQEFGDSTETATFSSTGTPTVKTVANARLDNLVVANIRPGDRLVNIRRPGGTVYTISVCGTADW